MTGLILCLVSIGFIHTFKFIEHPSFPHVQKYENGQIKTIGCIQNAFPTGTWITFFPNGTIESIEHYSPLYDEQWTYLIGTSFQYHSNGKIKRRTQYFNPDQSDSNFNFVGQFPGVTDGYDIMLDNGEIFCGDKWDADGTQLVKTSPVIRKNSLFILPLEYLDSNKYKQDTLIYKMNGNGWLELQSK